MNSTTNSGLVHLTVHNIQEMSSDQSGIYGIWFGSRCLYIGQSTDIRQRLLQHITQRHNHTLRLWIEAYRGQLRFCYLIRPTTQLTQLETQFIQRFKPEANVINN